MDILDNPVWAALDGRQQHFNAGNEALKFFPENVAPFVALQAWDAAGWQHLQQTLPAGRKFSVMQAAPVQFPAGFNVYFSCMLYQMTADREVPAPDATGPAVQPLGAPHVPAMLALTGLTRPGPFFTHTYTLGRYYGILQQGRLAAMAGERLKPPAATEISAICTHPDYGGNGYAGVLTRQVAAQIQQEGLLPFLHVKTDNTLAIGVYQKAGFAVRRSMFFAIFGKP